MNENVTAIVLAGGKGKRLGQAKATLKLGKRTIIEEVVDKMVGIAGEVIVVTSPSQNDLPHNLNAQVHTDIHPGKSALGGVYTYKADNLNSARLYFYFAPYKKPI